MFFKSIRRFRTLVTFTAILPLTAAGLAAQDAPDVIKLVPKVEPGEMARPTILPDRIVLTWNGDPTTTQAVTWRTSTEVSRGLAEITVADAAPDLESKSCQIVAVTQPLTTDLNTAHFHTVKFEELSP